ncbi:hypothetical protein B0H14DRAFT_3519172 [Mycena olivaceomarginata]|nr:hypothetical protein B0H14DRAFT_3519172 [Mycena olivaceomarginata]
MRNFRLVPIRYPVLDTGWALSAHFKRGFASPAISEVGPGSAIINQRALILGLALLFSDFDTILPSAASAHLGLGAQSAQSTATHEAADGRAHEPFFPPLEIDDAPRNADHIIDNTAPLRLDWAPPPPQGQTLRERVERRERQVRLRCCAPSCRVGPSDDNPFADARRSVRLLPIGVDGACTHMHHSVCLVLGHGTRDEMEVVCTSCSTRVCVPPAVWLEALVLAAEDQK